MDAIYDIDGRVVGWRQRNAIFDPVGKPRAFLTRQAVFNYNGDYLGRHEDRWYRDAAGHAVAFENGATGGPLPPLTSPPSAAPLPDPDPPPPSVEVPPPPRMRSAKWSALTWEQFLSGRHAPLPR